MGRAPCCDKANVKKGPWSPEEDAKLKSYIEQHGTGGNWIALPQKIGLKRCGKSCRLRWLNYLRPNIKHGGFTEEEDNIICSLFVSIGSRWSIIAAQLPGRTDNDIKNYWNTRLKKKLMGKQRKEQQAAQGRLVNSIKQEIKRENEDLVMTTGGVMNQTAPYWQVENISVPMAVAAAACTSNSVQLDHYDLKNQESVRSLLTKLGARFSDDNYQQPYTTTSVTPSVNPHYRCDLSSFSHQVYATPANLTNPAEVGFNIAADNNECNSQQSNMFQGFENFPSDLNELVYGNPQQTDVFGIMEDIGNASTGTTSTESTTNNWGDMSCLVYSPLVTVSDYYEGFSQGIMPQDVVYQKTRYFGMQ